MSEKPFATGGCLCGKVKYSLQNAPAKMAQCHCDNCRLSTGTGHMSLAFFNKDDADVKGTTRSYTTGSDSGAEVTRHFCPECGSRLFATNNAMTSMMTFTAGCFDDSSWFNPQAIVYNKRKPHWDFMDESVKTFEEMPPAPPK